MVSIFPTRLPASGAGTFTLLLFKWKGSLYKLCYKELMVFLVSYGTIAIIYRFGLDEDQKRIFEQLVRYFDRYLGMIPLSFILGFYVTTIATRWWQQYMTLPWPDKLMLCIAMYLPGSDRGSRQLRKTLLRYCNLMMVLVLRSFSDSVRNRLPTLDYVVQEGFMTKEEMECFQSTEADINLYWVPGLWFIHRLRESQQKGIIKDSQGMKLIMEQFLEYRAKCGVLWCYDWVTIPLVYTQVVTMATYSFFIACLFGRQWVDNVGNPMTSATTADYYFPFWTVLQFFFYMGLLKVAEQMINPYGDDDEDFELNFLIDRHMKAIHLGADVLCEQLPPMNESDVLFANFSQDTERQKMAKRKLSTTRTRMCSIDVVKMPTLQTTEEITTISGPVNKDLRLNTFEKLCSPEKIRGFDSQKKELIRAVSSHLSNSEKESHPRNPPLSRFMSLTDKSLRRNWRPPVYSAATGNHEPVLSSGQFIPTADGYENPAATTIDEDLRNGE